MKILHLDSSVTGNNSITRTLTAETVAQLKKKNADATVSYRDLVQEPLRHYSAVLRTHDADATPHTPEQKEELATGEAILAEFLASDVVVLGAPMYNFSVPSQLKAWIDLVCVAGKTFKYGAQGPEGLCGGKQVVIVSARGGKYGPGSPYEAADFQVKYLQAVCHFLGMTDVKVVQAEGVASGEEAKAAAFASARQEIAAL